MHLKFLRRLAIAVFSIGLANAAALRAEPIAIPEHPQAKVEYFGKFSELPVGTIRPRGWIEKWLERQAQGLTGHPENLSYPYDTCMYSGVIPPPPYDSKWWKEWWPYEQSAYFIDATTRLSWLINDPAITRRRDANLNYVLEHSSGTNFGGSRACWPNAVFGRALMAQYSATGNPAVASVVQNWLLTSSNAFTRDLRSGANFEEAYCFYGLTGDQRLLDVGRAIYGGYLHNTNSFCTVQKIESNAPFREHGVTAAEILKCLPLTYNYTGDPEALRLARLAYQKVLENNLMPDGGIVSSEHLERTAFYSVHESCDITDWSWSFGYMFEATGEGRYADLVERATFNALPGAVTKDFKQLQYFSAANQLVIGATNSHTHRWPTRMTFRAAHDTECCAGNINRAMPDYVVRMWMRPPNGGLAAVFYGPSEVTATLGGQAVSIAEETDYPFRDTINFRIKTAKPVEFNLEFRIPEWCDAASVQVNGKPEKTMPKPGTTVTLHQKFSDNDLIVLKLPMPVRVENWLQDQSVCVTRGPLVYSLKIDERRIEHAFDPPEIKPFLEGHNIQGFPEVEFQPESDWRYGFAAELKNNLAAIKVIESGMTANPFLEAQVPVKLELPLYSLPQWSPNPAATNDSKINTQEEPHGLPTAGEKIANAQPRIMTMIPYGSTYLRLTTLPLVPVAGH